MFIIHFYVFILYQFFVQTDLTDTPLAIFIPHLFTTVLFCMPFFIFCNFISFILYFILYFIFYHQLNNEKYLILVFFCVT